MTESLIRHDVVKKQLDRIPLKYPDLESMVRNDDMLEQLFEIESKSIEENREEGIINCGDFFFLLHGKKKQKEIIFSYPLDEIHRLCKGAPHRVIHWHGAYLGFQSDDDAATNREIFTKDGTGAIEGCSVGIDGIHCRTHYHDIRIPWSDKFYDKLKEKNGIVTHSNVKALTCKKKHGKGRHVTWNCTVLFKDGKGTLRNVFNEVTFERSKKDNPNQYALQMLEGNEKRIPFANYYREDYSDSDDVRCSVINSKDNTRRFLSCFKVNLE